jgi:hypothetical protein
MIDLGFNERGELIEEEDEETTNSSVELSDIAVSV